MILYISVHKTVRELDGKIYLALQSAKRRFVPIIGRKSAILKLLMEGPSGVFFDTRMNQSRLTVKNKNHFDLRKKGHDIWLFDEEATSIDDAAAYMKTQISRDVISNTVKCLAWSDYHANMIKSVCDASSVYVTGHPRYDVYDKRIREIYRKDAEKHINIYGRYILIPSSFGPYAFGENESLEKKIETNKRKGFFKTEDDVRSFLARAYYRRKSAENYLCDIVKLARKYQNINFVIRPHFVETNEMWATLLKNDLKNIHVVHDGPIASWIYGSIGVFHHHCSTAIEAFLFDKPVISYVPIHDERFERFLPAAVSTVVDEFEELVVAVGNIISGKPTNKKDQGSIDLDYYIKNNNEKLASDQILDLVQESVEESEYDGSEDPKRYFSSLEKKPSFRSLLSALKRGNKGEGEPRITLQLLNERLKLFTAIDPEFERCHARQIGDELFYISAED